MAFARLGHFAQTAERCERQYIILMVDVARFKASKDMRLDHAVIFVDKTFQPVMQRIKVVIQGV